MTTYIMLHCAVGVFLLALSVHGQGFKPGQCPDDFEIYNSTEPSCPEETCTIDQDCEGEQLCCSNGCSTECVSAQDDVLRADLAKMSILACEGTSVTLSCPSDHVLRITSAFWGRGDSVTCSGIEADPSDNLVCSHYRAFDYLAARCDGTDQCDIPVDIGYFGDPCTNQTTKYLRAEYYCEHKVYRGEVCEVSGKLTLICPDNKRILARSAFFGRDSEDVCPHSTRGQRTNCSLDTATEIFQLQCGGKERCNLDAWTGHFGDPCPDTYKYLLVDYSCADCFNEYGDDYQCDLWWMLGECTYNPNWMMDKCRKSCWQCDDTPPVCENVYFNDTACEEWVEAGNCYTDAAWMHTYCRKACTACDQLTDCSVNKWDRDFNESDCLRWYNDGHCQENMHYMFWDCTKACFGCSTDNSIRCSNKYIDTTQCEIWALNGECQTNAGYMIANCFKACTGCTEDPRCENVFPDETCDSWEAIEECSENPVFMHQYCWKSCMKCDAPPACVNRHSNDAECELWAQQGDCFYNPYFMLNNCTKSCTRCAPVSEAVSDCLNTGANDTQCNSWASRGFCALNPSWMITNCKKSCSLCTDNIYRLTTVGAPPMPGKASNLTRAMTFILPGTFPQIAYLTHFMVFFVRLEPVYLQIWQAKDDGSYVRVYNHKVVPSGYNTAQTVLAAACVKVFPGDQVGFSTFSGRAAPIAQNPIPRNDVFTKTAYRRASSVSPFVKMIYPFEFSLSAGYDINSPCFNN